MHIPEHIALDLQNGFVMTDVDDGFQRVKVVNDTTFIYRSELSGDTFELTIDVDDIDKDMAISGYYDSVKQVSEHYGEDANMIIAECFYEHECRS